MNVEALVERTRATRDRMLESMVGRPGEQSARGHLLGYDTDNKIRGWITLYKDAVIPCIRSFEGSTGLDLGCWSGLGTSLLSELGARRVIGVDLNEDLMAFADVWSREMEFDRVSFASNPGGVVPLRDETMDWVYVNQVFCNMPRSGFEQALAEIARVLRRGGRLVLCDSNNPHCPATLARLAAAYRAREFGAGDESKPAGPVYKERCRFIRSLLPDTDDRTIELLAGNTCYMWGDELSRAIHAYAHAGQVPSSRFIEGCARAPVQPYSGIPTGNVTDPFWFAARLEELGVSVSINTAAGEGPDDPAQLLDLLRQSQSFYVLGTKR